MVKGLRRLRSISLLSFVAFYCVASTAAAADINQLLQLGKRSFENGNYVQSEAYFRQAIQEASTIQGSERQVVQALARLGAVLLLQHRTEESEIVLRRAAAIYETHDAINPSYLPVILNNLATAYQRAGQLQRAESTFKQAITLVERSSGKESLEAADLRANLAALYLRTGKTKKAKAILTAVLAYEEQLLGRAHPRLAPILTNLASAYFLQKEWSLAEPLLVRALQNVDQSLGPEHPDNWSTLHALGLLYFRQGQLPKAEAMLRRALELQRKVLGTDSAGTVLAAMDLAAVKRAQGSYVEAGQLYAESLEIQERTFGPKGEEVAVTLERFAGLLRETNREEMAADMEARAQSIRDELRDTVSIKTLLQSQGREFGRK